jgi:penicillin amidase
VTDSQSDLNTRCVAALADLAGEANVPGLTATVEVIRDRWGIPHIYAENQPDLFFAQGFVAAQDRLFQMDLWRRIAIGETAELLGEAGLEADRFARLVRYRGDMEAEWTSYSPDTQQITTSFVAGINAYIDFISDKLPIEFELLKCRPKKWQPEDCLGRMSGIVMSRNFRNELQRAKLIAEVGIEEARRLAPTDPPFDYEAPDGVDLSSIDPQAILAALDQATGPLPFSPDDGSNNWVVDGSSSASGKPLLASDPHRPSTMPSLRYMVHLNAPGWNVIGSGEPALPGVAIGHNDRIAWGFTIICTDQADFFIEETHPDDPTRYRVGDEWESMTIIREQVTVAGQSEPTETELRFTRHGPVIHQDGDTNQAFALKWTGSEPGTAAYLPSLAIGRAGNWNEFHDAVARWKLPSENMLYADVDGHVGWVAAALTPVRENHKGLLPVNGAEGQHEWQRFLNVDELPQLFDPPDHIVTANHNILPEGYEQTIAYEWAPTYRNDRIHERLAEKSTFEIDDFASMHHDSTSIPGRKMAGLAAGMSFQEAELESIRAKFAEWDGHLSRESHCGPVYGYWLDELLTACFEQFVSADLLEFVAGQTGIPVILAALESPDERWFGANPTAARDELLRRTFASAVDQVKEALGDDVATWRWDRLHTVSFVHPLSSMGEDIAAAFDRGPIGQSGDGLCPNATRYEEAFAQVSGASYRQLFDLADWDKGLATSAPGQSGQPGSPHYDDLLPLWKNDEYFPLVFSREAVEREAKHHLRLKPAE